MGYILPILCVCSRAASVHACTQAHTPVLACRLTWNTVPSFTWLCNLFLVHHERKKSIRCSRCCKFIAPCYFHQLHSHCPERNQGFSIQLSFLCLDNWISVSKGFRNPSYTDRMCQIYNFRSKQIEGHGSIHPSIHPLFLSIFEFALEKYKDIVPTFNQPYYLIVENKP